MSQVEDFLRAAGQEEFVQASIAAEKDPSGEIRVHLEPSTDLDHFNRAQQLFHLLKMDNTKRDNGVLLYVAVQDKKFVIYGGSGIDRVVPKDFWETTKDVIASHFRKGKYKEGIVAGIARAGQELKAHFPWDQNDTNELSDAISKG